MNEGLFPNLLIYNGLFISVDFYLQSSLDF